MVRVVPDVPALDREFDYLVPDQIAADVRTGTMVRIQLQGRRVGAWVVADDVEPPAGVALRPVAKVTGWGPDADVIELARWAAWRWAGRPAHFLRTASPPNAVRRLPVLAPPGPIASGVVDPLAERALDAGSATLRLPPGADRHPLVLQAARRGTTLVVAPSHAAASHLALRLRRAGVSVALLPSQWAEAAAGARVVVGARAAAWAPAVDPAVVVVLEEHEEAHQEESAPTWSARDVAAERARRAGAACVWVSACPSLEAVGWAPLIAPSRRDERAGWPFVDVVDRRHEDPLRADLYSDRLVALVRQVAGSGGRVLCLLNRKGRARLLACAACRELARCEVCGATVASGDADELRCTRCDASRPALCTACGSGRLKVLRLGVSRAREDLARLAGVPVGEVTGDGPTAEPVPDEAVLVGTEAVLHRVDGADAVAFLDLDAELLAPRYRAAEQAMALLARAARVVGGKSGGGRLLIQTRLPRHEVVQAALLADPGRVAEAEAARREALRFPPATALAQVAGASAGRYIEQLGDRLEVEVLGPAPDGSFLVRAADHAALCDALSATARPPGRLRVAVDPRRV